MWPLGQHLSLDTMPQPYASVQTPLWGMATTVRLCSVLGSEEPPVPGLLHECPGPGSGVRGRVWPQERE